MKKLDIRISDLRDIPMKLWGRAVEQKIRHAGIELSKPFRREYVTPSLVRYEQEDYPEWRPIETAPKDGTEILLCNSELRLKGVGFYGCLPEHSTPEFLQQNGISVFLKPTHWYPLPGWP